MNWSYGAEDGGATTLMVVRGLTCLPLILALASCGESEAEKRERVAEEERAAAQAAWDEEFPTLEEVKEKYSKPLEEREDRDGRVTIGDYQP